MIRYYGNKVLPADDNFANKQNSEEEMKRQENSSTARRKDKEEREVTKVDGHDSVWFIK